MTRWHNAYCATPNVVVDTTIQTPHCLGCNAVVEIDRIIADHVAHHTPVEIPPDEPVGQMALWWPPSVPYTLSHGKDVSKQASDVTPLAQPRQSTSSFKASPSAYETTLSAEEFRLARFDAPPDGAGPDNPIHITLEVFRRDDCPEYETVSYTWGGEEDDSTPCRPVFVGPHWDVLLQTANCWHMLRYLRPRRGIRLVWIDAICINQDDPAERGLQVANMRSVYQQCSRVVIYLGADLVAPPTSGIEARMHPPRHGLHEFDRVMGPSLGGKEKAMTLPDLLLTRRYFSRVWVIQEVLLSRAAVIPIAGREFWANCLTPIKYVNARKLENPSLSEEWDWESTTVPWMRDLCGGSPHTSTTFYDVLRRTWKSKATDPRDKFFGVLGLVDSQSLGPPGIAPQELNGLAPASVTPDYNISVRHVLIGIMAHALLKLGITEVLVNASGLAAPPNHPSWLPDLYISERQRAEREKWRARYANLHQCRRHNRAWLRFSTRGNYWKQSTVPLTYLTSQASWAWSNGDDVKSDDPFGDSLDSETRLGGSGNQQPVSHPSLDALHSWRAGATVDPSTGDLLLKVSHLLQFDSCPRRADRHPGIAPDPDTPIIPYLVRAGSSSLFVSVPETGPYLDQSVPAGKNHLFYLEKEDTGDGPPESLLLFLREVEGPDMDSCGADSRPRDFKLVLCCPYLDLFLMFWKHNRPDGSAIGERTIHEVNLRHSLYTTLLNVRGKIVKESSDWPRLYFPLNGHYYDEKNTPRRLPEPAGWEQMFPGHYECVLPLDQVLPLGQIILSSERSGAETETAFAREYIACLNTRLPLHDARLVNEMDADNLQVAWVEMSILPSAVGLNYWNQYGNPFCPAEVIDWSRSQKISWEWRYSSSTGADQAAGPEKGDHTELEMGNHGPWTPFIGRFDAPRPEKGEIVTIRTPVSDLVGFVKTTKMFKQMQRLHFMFRPPENSSERPPVKVKTWAGEEDETDMILRGPQEGDHFLPERPYRPWPEEVVRDFKADGVYWNIKIS